MTSIGYYSLFCGVIDALESAVYAMANALLCLSYRFPAFAVQGKAKSTV